MQLRELALLAKEAAVGLGIDEPRALAPQQHTAGELSIYGGTSGSAQDLGRLVMETPSLTTTCWALC